MLAVQYRINLKTINLGLVTENSKLNNETNEVNDSQSFVKYSDYKLLLRKIRSLEDIIKKLKDELEVVHS